VLQAAGFDVRVEPFFSDEYVRDLQAGRRSYARVATAYVRRLAALLPWRPADLVWIEKEAFPWLPLWLERLALPENVPVALDYDDAVFHLYERHRSEVVRRLLGGKHRGGGDRGRSGRGHLSRGVRLYWLQPRRGDRPAVCNETQVLRANGQGRVLA